MGCVGVAEYNARKWLTNILHCIYAGSGCTRDQIVICKRRL